MLQWLWSCNCKIIVMIPSRKEFCLNLDNKQPRRNSKGFPLSIYDGVERKLLCSFFNLEVGCHFYSEFAFRKIHYSGALGSIHDNKQQRWNNKGSLLSVCDRVKGKLLCSIFNLAFHCYSEFAFRKIYYFKALGSILDNKQQIQNNKGSCLSVYDGVERKLLCSIFNLRVRCHFYSEFTFR
jgi:hypothetical protein